MAKPHTGYHTARINRSGYYTAELNRRTKTAVAGTHCNHQHDDRPAADRCAVRRTRFLGRTVITFPWNTQPDAVKKPLPESRCDHLHEQLEPAQYCRDLRT